MQKKVPKWQETSKINPSKLTSLGVLLALIWLAVALLNGDPDLFVILGGFNLIITIIVRFRAQKNKKMELEGGIGGFLFLWFLAYFLYQEKSALIANSSLQLNEVMVIYLGIAFLVWFVITPDEASQELIFGFSPFLSNLILNFWKISILFLFLVNLRELRFLNGVAVIIFLVTGFLDLFIAYSRKLRINYVDLILNPVKLLSALLPVGQTLKWVLLPLIFIILGQMELDLWTVSLMIVAMFIAIISIITGVTKLTLSSGMIESRVEEGKTLMPKVIDEVVSMSSLENLETFDEFYRVPKEIVLQKRNEVVTFNQDDVILHFPFSNELQSQTGAFVFHLNMHNVTTTIIKKKRSNRGTSFTITMGSKEFQKEVKNSVSQLSLKGSTVHRIPLDKWISLKNDLEQLTREEFAKYVGFDDVKELDKKLAKAVQGTIKVQEQIRSRIRGVPAPSFNFKDKIVSKMSGNSLKVPTKLLEELDIPEDQELELVKGKDEYLFYVRLKK